MQEFTAIVEVDSQGRVTIPPVIRKALKLRKGSIITIAIREIEFPTGKNENPLRALVQVPAHA